MFIYKKVTGHFINNPQYSYWKMKLDNEELKTVQLNLFPSSELLSCSSKPSRSAHQHSHSERLVRINKSFTNVINR
jgi:hypothetical protein